MSKNDEFSIDDLVSKYTFSKDPKKPKNDENKFEEIYKERELNKGVFSPTSSYNQNQSIVLNSDNRNWYRKSYQRCCEQSKELGISIRDCLLQRYDPDFTDILEREFSSKPWQKPRYNPKYSAKVEEPTHEKNEEKSEESSKKESSANISVEEKEVSEEDINKMSAQLIKQEMMGNVQKANKIRANLEKLKEAKRRGIKIRVSTKTKTNQKPSKVDDENASMLTKTDDYGNDVPIYDQNFASDADKNSKRGKKFKTHDENNKRIAYTYDDSVEKSIGDLVKEEKLESAHDANMRFATCMSKIKSKNSDDEYEGETFAETSQKSGKVKYMEKTNAIQDYKRKNFAESQCQNCLARIKKHTIIYFGSHVFVRVPDCVSTLPGHCLISTYEHVGALTRCNEEVQKEISLVKRSLTKMYLKANWHCPDGDGDGPMSRCGKSPQSVIFMELADVPTAFQHHLVIECIPVPVFAISELRIYFKKTLSDTGSEWDANKKVRSLKNNYNGAAGLIPPNFAYFSVEFGNEEEGFVKAFDKISAIRNYFGREIIGGYFDIDQTVWRKPKEDALDSLLKKTREFEENFESFAELANKVKV